MHADPGALAGATMAEPAPAKLNLALHVTGRRPDGYHLLDSLVVFADVGDRLEAEPARDLTLTLDGPFAGDLAADDDNLVLRAARLIRPADRGARLRLHKVLPVAAGIGGGSADAAAALRLLARLWSVPLPDPADVLGLGADVPVCLAARPARMRGIGEALEPLALPCLWAVLVNPGAPVSTGAVFAGLARSENPGLPEPLRFPEAASLLDWLAGTRNDLEAPACARLPVIAQVLAALTLRPGCAIARMSGSGATCFGLFARPEPAAAAAAAIARAEPGWWVRMAALITSAGSNPA